MRSRVLSTEVDSNLIGKLGNLLESVCVLLVSIDTDRGFDQDVIKFGIRLRYRLESTVLAICILPQSPIKRCFEIVSLSSILT